MNDRASPGLMSVAAIGSFDMLSVSRGLSRRRSVMRDRLPPRGATSRPIVSVLERPTPR
ncbi:hypothetical protein BPA30113_06143 [Burkholderia paludis]|uniref:Uncharacterized protein n=1 Tax=Burkholderia paludis TaxID=1506587 RepID=A0A6P2R6K6_9BURK|nr:hypothetical protein [Burkholderia sp. MSh2]CAB3771536.1 hypothetical protein LMG30113_06489 [Burkholderia paludis]VWC28458.1 hypothetical protein BPA30113_06143 [Burkholderia paludis]